MDGDTVCRQPRLQHERHNISANFLYGYTDDSDPGLVCTDMDRVLEAISALRIARLK